MNTKDEAPATDALAKRALIKVAAMNAVAALLFVPVLFGALGEPPRGREHELLVQAPAFFWLLSIYCSPPLFFVAYILAVLGRVRPGLIAGAAGLGLWVAALLAEFAGYFLR